ncbi:hypothetical protein ACLKA7_014076 [Drosophila subpalustris]
MTSTALPSQPARGASHRIAKTLTPLWLLAYSYMVLFSIGLVASRDITLWCSALSAGAAEASRRCRPDVKMLRCLMTHFGHFLEDVTRHSGTSSNRSSDRS